MPPCLSTRCYKGVLASLLLFAGLVRGQSSSMATAATPQGSDPALPFAPNAELSSAALNSKVDALLAQMTLEEKVGQLVQDSAGVPAGPANDRQDLSTMLAKGEIGSLVNEGPAHTASTARETNAYQRIAVEKSRLHVPLIFGLDVIHGYRTIFPEPLGLAASFDPELIQSTARMAAQEASADGIRWTFSPMVDIARDARWGRIAEGAGEEPYLGSAVARAYVRGYQGTSLANPDSIAACVKHFAAYGAVTAGREYNSVDMSDLTLRQVYLPPYRAAIDAGAATLMSALNALNGVPATGNPYLLTKILRDEWGFNGFVVSDWASVHELVAHGIAVDDASAARKALTAGLDMDMVGNAYQTQLVSLVRDGVVPQAVVDQTVRRVLRVKFALGLFDHPYADEQAAPYKASSRQRTLARKAAEESLVLLQNEKSTRSSRLLPIAPQVETLALIGPLADSGIDMLGSWSAGSVSDAVTLRTSLAERMKSRGGKLLYAKGTEMFTASESGFEAALEAARQANVAVLALGEDASNMISEASSRTHLDLPGNQQKLLEAVVKQGKPVVLIVFSGRPLVLDWAATHVSAIVEAWYPGIEAGPALVSMLFGDTNPSGRSPVSFPRAVGQEPLYLGQLSTGRPASGVDLSHPPAVAAEQYYSRYIDAPNSPLYPYGYGLSYTEFHYSPLQLNRKAIAARDVSQPSAKAKPLSFVDASVTIRNVGPVAGTEVAQLYVQIKGASVAQPVRSLKGFQRVSLRPGESRQVDFHLGFDELAFVNTESRWVVEPAEYTFFVGGSSLASERATFTTLR